jgi:hypothetical protein
LGSALRDAKPKRLKSYSRRFFVTDNFYEIRVAGTVPPEALADYEDVCSSVESVETVLCGPLADQAALQGLLARLDLFGAQVIEVRRRRNGGSQWRSR